MKKQIRILALAALLTLSLLPLSAFAETDDFFLCDGVLVKYEGREEVVVLPDSVTKIENEAFQECATLTHVTIPDSVTSIGCNAFTDCVRLTSVSLPGTVTHFGGGVFSGCDSLASVTFADGATSIGGAMFERCTALTSIVFPNSMKKIGNYAFERCTSLTSVIFPDSVTEIGTHAFEGCTALTDVYYSGSEEDWKKIQIQEENAPLLQAAIHYRFSPSADSVAYASTQIVLVDGRHVAFQCYALKDENGNDTNYIKLRDVASVLNDTAAQFDVGWDGSVNIETGKAYRSNGSEMNTPYFGVPRYENATAPTKINGRAAALNAIVLKDDAGNGYTYYKLRDLGEALGFTVDWSAETGILIEIE